MILKVRISEKRPIERPIIARMLAFDEKLFPNLEYKKRRTICRCRFIINVFLLSL